MSLTIQRLIIRKLHGVRDYNIEIKDNKIVMVGVNGLGKTTVVNLLYLILSRQWNRTLAYDFASITITLNGQDYTLEQSKGSDLPLATEELIQGEILRILSAANAPFSPELIERLARAFRRNGTDGLAAEMDRALSLPTSICRKLARDIRLEPKSYDSDLLGKVDNAIKKEVGDDQVLYLPTYRRIEKELAFIFPDLDEPRQYAYRHRTMGQRETRSGYIELVEFGMEDVEETFLRAQRELVATAKSEWSNLAGGYLRDVIRGEGEHYEIETFRQLDNTTIDRILDRAEERTLLDTDKARLRAVIEKLKTTESAGLQPIDRYIGHFFTKLVNVDRALSEKEQLIARFTDVCNKYLTGKRIQYDDKDSSIGARLVPSNKPLPLRYLSSGEKQIVSLFSHLYLRERGRVLVIIDEPELSLSVTWQQQLLPDIVDTAKCQLLVAVTHSPFIFDNALDGYAVNLSECITEAQQ